MPNSKSPLVLGLLAAACAHEGASTPPAAASPEPTSNAAPETLPGFAGVMAPPGDAEAAIRSEFSAIEQRGTAEAYEVFAQRHPGHALAEEAARRARALRQKAH